jgi:hypothetical protein
MFVFVLDGAEAETGITQRHLEHKNSTEIWIRLAPADTSWATRSHPAVSKPALFLWKME